jgi:hypothetical protein
MAIVHDDHNFASNAKANAALTTGIIGTSGFGLALLNGLGGIFGNGGGLGNPAVARPMCNEDHFVNRYEASQSARIAELETEVKFRDSNIYTDQKLLELYKYFDGENKQMRADFCEYKGQQAVVNANLTSAVDVLGSQINDTRAVLAGITRTAVPSNVICNMCCNTCGAGANF